MKIVINEYSILQSMGFNPRKFQKNKRYQSNELNRESSHEAREYSNYLHKEKRIHEDYAKNHPKKESWLTSFKNRNSSENRVKRIKDLQLQHREESLKTGIAKVKNQRKGAGMGGMFSQPSHGGSKRSNGSGYSGYGLQKSNQGYGSNASFGMGGDGFGSLFGNGPAPRQNKKQKNQNPHSGFDSLF